MPQEDQGFFFVNVQLPEAASMQRTNAVMRKIDEILKAEPGVHYVNAVSGYSLLSQTASPRNGLYFVQLAPYEERATRELQSDAIVASVNRKLYGLPDAQAFAFLPPAIPGVGQAGGVDVFIQDRAGKTVDYLWQNTQRFMAELRKRPEIAFLATTYAPAVPQLFAHVDEDRVLKLGVPIQDVYQTLQAFLGGAYVNQFNRFGRVWRVFLQAEPEYRTDPGDLSLFYVRNRQGDAIPLSTLVSLEKSSGPEYSNRFNEYRAIEVIAMPAPGYSSGQAMAAVSAVADQVLPRDMGYAWNGMSYQESIAGSGAAVFALSLLIVFLILAALYESWSLPWTVLLTHAGRRRGRVLRPLGARPREQRLRPGRAPHADWPLGEERDPDRRVRKGRAREGRVDRRRGPQRRAEAASADPHDVVRVHPRPGAALERARRRRRGAPGDRHGHDRRHDVFDRHRHLPRPRAVRVDRAALARATDRERRRSRARARARPRPQHASRAGWRGTMKASHLVATLLVTFTLAGCSATAGALRHLEVGPDYERPHQLLTVVALYKALGGGWKLTDDAWTGVR